MGSITQRIIRRLWKGITFIVPDSEINRVVERNPSAGAESDWYSSAQNLKVPWACTGVFSSAGDMAKYGQMYLNGGVYGNFRVLSKITVQEMTRNQIPEIRAVFGDESFDEASWGYGWNVHSNKKEFSGNMHSSRAFEAEELYYGSIQSMKL